MSEFESVDSQGVLEDEKKIERVEEGEGAEEEAQPEDSRSKVADLGNLEEDREGFQGFLRLNLGGAELQILLYLQTCEMGATAKSISANLWIPEKNVYRYLAKLEKRELVYSGGRPRVFHKSANDRAMDKAKRPKLPEMRKGGKGK